ncbi:hypothetical protein K7X08_018837 [Anisodus acutangulus]|uniref:Uncharacterized protein n=1 Tax=Anisodus acutangulus TaxID=402998 RepID=A0A9Q1R7L5_9SOLA|nr:hypothetical protein K7X08_018837 [Anisodus acutangulus]
MYDSMDRIIGSTRGIRKMLVYQFSGNVVKQEQMPDDISGDSAFDSIKASHMNAQYSSALHQESFKSTIDSTPLYSFIMPRSSHLLETQFPPLVIQLFS